MVYEVTPGGILDQNYLMHHGIKGQKWGERRFQNPDGTLTAEGKARYQKYVKDFGEKTANRLIKSIQKGNTEKQAMQKEYDRRSSGTSTAVNSGAIAGTLAGGILGAKVSQSLTNRTGNLSNMGNIGGLNVLGPNKVYSMSNGLIIGGLAGDILGSTGGLVLHNKINGYKLEDISEDGLKKFYKKMKEYEESYNSLEDKK